MPPTSAARALHGRRPQHPGRGRGGTRLPAAGRRRAPLPQLQRPPAGESRLPAPARHGLAGRHPAAASRTARRSSAVLRRRGPQRIAALPGVEAVGLQRHASPGPQPHLGRGRRRASSTPRASTRSPIHASSTPTICRSCGSRSSPAASSTRPTTPGPRRPSSSTSRLARQLWPDRDALGQRIAVNGESTVIGVVADVRHAALESPGGQRDVPRLSADRRLERHGDGRAQHAARRRPWCPRSAAPWPPTIRASPMASSTSSTGSSTTPWPRGGSSRSCSDSSPPSP